MNLPESTLNLLLSALMGAISGFLTIPINAYIMYHLKRDELSYQHKLDVIAKERELLLQHKLELKRKELDNDEISKLKDAIKLIQNRLENTGI